MYNKTYDGWVLLPKKGKPLLYWKYLKIKGASNKGEEKNRVSRSVFYILQMPLEWFIYK